MKPAISFLIKRALLYVAAIGVYCHLSSCNKAAVDKSQPYHDYDASVIPLVDSYRLMKLDGANQQWMLSLKNKPASIENIDTIGLAEHTILVHSPETYGLDTLRVQSWFVLNATSHIEKQFESRKLYVQYLMAHKINVTVVPVEEVAGFMKAVKRID